MKEKLHNEQIRFKEALVIDRIPDWVQDQLGTRTVEFRAKGGCPGCRSQVIGVHYHPCKLLDKEDE